MALKIDPGSHRVVLEFINQKLVLGADALILLGLITICVALFWIKPEWQKVIFIVAGCLLISKICYRYPA